MLCLNIFLYTVSIHISYFFFLFQVRHNEHVNFNGRMTILHSDVLEIPQIANGRLLKTWHAHNKSVNCLLFSNDDSLLISGSEDGMICVWSVIR